VAPEGREVKEECLLVGLRGEVISLDEEKSLDNVKS
jgi:hypothetical protein